MTLEHLIDLLLAPLVAPRRSSGWRSDGEAWREHAKWLTLHAHWVEGHYEEMAGFREGPDELHDPMIAPRGPQQLLEGTTSSEEPITYRAGRVPSLRKIKDGERPVEYLYRNASISDQACAEEFATRQRLKKVAALKRRVFLQRLDSMMQARARGESVMEKQATPIKPPPVTPGLQPLNWGWDEAEPA